MNLQHGIKAILVSLFFLCFGAPTVAKADTIAFSGTRYEFAPAASPGGSCSPAPTLIVNSTIGAATGTSNLGNFTADQVSCLDIPFPAPITAGVFTWTFDDGDALSGTFSGLASRTNIPGGGHLLTIQETYLVTGGTGSFLDATGSIFETGTGTSTGVNAKTNYTFDGTLTGPSLSATPEPGTLSLAGTGLAWAALRLRRSRKTYSPKIPTSTSKGKFI